MMVMMMLMVFFFRSELFSSLLGQKVRVDEEDDGPDEEDVDMDGLRLFRS